MMRRMGSGRLGRRDSEFNDSVNPMEGLSNLADVMLVFACGMMLALVINWNLDITPSEAMVDVQQGQEITENVEDMGSGEGVLMEDGEYQRMGVVYRDADGNLYMVEKEEGGGEG